jgi:multicomponent Na+:H+ antiporter subunit E
MAEGGERAELPVLYRPAVQAASMTVGLTVLWLLLSGQGAIWFLALGVISIALSVLIAIRMDLIDHEGAPAHIYGRATTLYWIWLLWEIAKADWYIAKCVFRPLSSLSPTMFRAPTTQKSALGQAIYANSITLTPGTVTVDIEPGTVLVHAITAEAASGVQEGEMDRRVRELE